MIDGSSADSKEEPVGDPAGSSSISGSSESSEGSGWAPRPRAEVLADLARRGFQFRKNWGQNFLFDPQLLEAFLDDAKLTAGERVLEVGMGAGTLTERMLGRGIAVVGAEIDPILIDHLGGRGEHPDLQVVPGDALGSEEQLAPPLREALDRAPGPYRLVANLPYAIATPLVMRLVARDPQLAGIAVLVQTEVAERWIATPGGRDFGPAAVVLEGFGKGRITRKVPGHLFTPAPRVSSSFYVWEPAEDLDRGAIAPLLAFARGIFAQRRKMLRGILRDQLPEGDPRWAEAGVDPTARPEELEIAQIRRLATILGGFGENPE